LTGLIDRRARDILDNLAGPKDPEQQRQGVAVVQRPISSAQSPALPSQTSPGT
jgi:hypothetical protein